MVVEMTQDQARQDPCEIKNEFNLLCLPAFLFENTMTAVTEFLSYFVHTERHKF